jgi:hypothetical protein
MGWLSVFFGGDDVCMRGATNRSYEKLATQFGPGPATAILASALAHACYPSYTNGDKGIGDEIVRHLKKLKPGPCDSKSACDYVMRWLDKSELTTEQVFVLVWGAGPNQFLVRFMHESGFGSDKTA